MDESEKVKKKKEIVPALNQLNTKLCRSVGAWIYIPTFS
jgi:hypothetical protein